MRRRSVRQLIRFEESPKEVKTMNHYSLKSRRHREAGAALITVLMVSLCTAMLLAASLTVAMTTQMLGYNQANSQAAMELADAGANSELQTVALNIGIVNTLLKSSLPVVYSGVSAILPSTGSIVKGRPGTVTGYLGGTYYVSSSNDA